MYTNIEGEKAQTKMGKWKKLERGKLKNTKTAMEIAESTMGMKLRLLEDKETEDEGRQKRICEGMSLSFIQTAVAARQHCQEP